MLIELLEKKKLSISTVESLTGGMLSARLVDISGISKYYYGSYITYSDEAKIKLGVKRSSIKKYSAVSSVVAKEMVENLIKNTNTDIGIATTGVAGPKSDDFGNEIGLVYIAFYIRGDIEVNEYHFTGDRAAIREETVRVALKVLQEKLQNII